MIAEPEPEAIDMDVVRQDAREDLLLYSQLCDHRYRPAKVHRFVSDKLHESVISSSYFTANPKTFRKNKIFNEPPRHGKTRLCAIEFPTWLLGLNPRIKIVCASYGQKLSEESSREARDRISGNAAYRSLFPNTLPNPRKWSADLWETTQGGGYRAVGVEAALTGFSAHVLICDDLHKDFAEAKSITERERVWDWFLSTAMTRLEPGAIIILIGTRWNVDDITGRLIDPTRVKQMQEREFEDALFEHYNLAGIAEENDPMGRKPGEALWPEKFSKKWIEMKIAFVGDYIANALYMGRPTLKGGNYIHSGNFMCVDESDVPPSQQHMRYWDIAETAKKSSDYTAGAKGFIDGAGNFWIMDVERGQWIWPDARQTIISRAKIERILVGFEKTSMTSAFDNLKEVMDFEAPEAVVIGYDVDKDKLTRALPWIALSARKKIFLVRRKTDDWIPAFKAECDEFGPGCKHDDQIDAVSGLYNMLKDGGGWNISNVPRVGEVEQFRASRSRTLI